MGSDLSIVVRPCVPLVAEGIPDSTPISFTELRLIDGTSCLESDRILLAECTPFALSSLDLRDTDCYSVLHSELQCKSCERRIGLSVDSSVRVGTRVHGADQRCAFTQGLSIFLSKLAAALSSSGTVESADEPFVDTQSSSIDRYTLLLIDLRHCLLDDVSGPWLVRDLEDLMGCVLHYHSAVSLISSARRGVGNSPAIMHSGGGSSLGLSVSETVYLYDDVTPCRLGPTALTDSGALPISDSSRASFCQSVRHIFLSHNNMSVVGLRKCLHSILELARTTGNEFDPACKETVAGGDETESSDRVMRKKPGLWYLESIDVQQNEESLAVRQMLTSMLHQTKVRVLVGTSGLRWRHSEGEAGSVARPAMKLFDSLQSSAVAPGEEREGHAFKEGNDEVWGKKSGEAEEEEEEGEDCKEGPSSSGASPDDGSPQRRRRLPNSKQKIAPKLKNITLNPPDSEKTREEKAISPVTPEEAFLVPTFKKIPALSEESPARGKKRAPPTQAAKTTPRSQEKPSASGSARLGKGSMGNAGKTFTLTASKKSAGPSNAPQSKTSTSRSKAVAPISNESLNLSTREDNFEFSEVESSASRKEPANALNASDEVSLPKLPIDSVHTQTTSNESMRKSFSVFEATPHENGPVEAEPLEGDLPAAYSPSPRRWSRQCQGRFPSEKPQPQGRRGSARAEALPETRATASASPVPETEAEAPQSLAAVAAAADRAAAERGRNQRSTRTVAKQRRTRGSAV